MSREDLFNRIATLTGGRAAEEVVLGSVSTGASNDIEQATRLARAMVTRYGMSEKYDMMGLETVNNAYLGGDTSLTCSSETAADIDREVLKMITKLIRKPVSLSPIIWASCTRQPTICWIRKLLRARSSWPLCASINSN